MISDAGGSEEMIKCATRYPCSVCKRMSRPPLRRPVSVPRNRQFNDTLLADVHFWNYQGREVLVYSLIDEATRFHVTQIVPSQSARDLYEAIMNAWVKWAGAPRFLLVDPHRSHLAPQFIEQLGAQGTTVLVGAAEASWTRGLVERHGAYVRSMVEKMVHDGVPDDMSAQSLFDKATSAKNMMSRIRGYSPSQWVLATQPRIPESLMIDDEDEDHVPHKDIPESQDDEFARSVRVRDAARRAFIAVDTDQRLRRAAISASRPDRLTFEPGDMCYFWRNGLGWSPGMATVVSQVGQGHYHVDYGGRIFKQAAEQLSHVTERERLAQEAVRESRDSDRDMDHVSDEPELHPQPSQFPEQRPNVDAPVPEQPPDVSMPAPDFQETPDDNADDSDHEERAPTEPVPQSSSSHWEWRPEYEVPPPEPGDPGMTRRRIVAKRPPTDDEEEEMRQKRLRSESVPELFPLTGEELSEDVFEILVDLFASPVSTYCENSHVSAGSEHCDDSRVPEAHVYTQDRDRARPLKRRVEVSMRNLTREDRDAFTRAKQKEWASWLDKEAVEMVKDRLKVPRSHILRARWVLTWKNVGTEKVPKARLCALGFQDPRLTTLPTSSPTLTSDGESAILQWIVNEGHLLESGDLKTAFLSGDPDPAFKGSDALYIDPPSDLKRWLNLGPEDVLRLRKAVYGLINAPLRWHQRLSRALRQAGFVPLQMDPCIWILPAASPVQRCCPCRCANQVENSCCRFLCVTCCRLLCVTCS